MTMKLAEPKPNTFPMVVDSTKGWLVNSQAIVDGYRYLVVGIDDGTNTLFVRPLGKRRERRAALRRTFR